MIVKLPEKRVVAESMPTGPARQPQAFPAGRQNLFKAWVVGQAVPCQAVPEEMPGTFPNVGTRATSEGKEVGELT